MNSTKAGLSEALNKNYPGHNIQSIIDRGKWVHHHVEVTLDSGEVIFFKIGSNPEWSHIKHDANVAIFFREHSLPAPEVLAVDTTCSILPYPYMIQRRLGGTRLCNLLKSENPEEQSKIYETIGQLYQRMHAIKNAASGLWGDEPRKIRYPVAPHDYMYNADIVNGCGKTIVERGLISKSTHERAVELWKVNLDYLKDHQPTLIHYSPFIWNIYLEKSDEQWRVSKLMSLGDVMWWDADYDLAALQYPSFENFNMNRWTAFMKGYGSTPQRKRALLYLILQRFSAAAGGYMEPLMEVNVLWAKDCLKDINTVMDEIESL